jgi:hypothetical protein
MDAELRSTASSVEGEYRGFANVAIVLQISGATPAEVDARGARFVHRLGALVDVTNGVDLAPEDGVVGALAEALRARGHAIPALPGEEV